MAKLRINRRKLERLLDTPITVRDLVAFLLALTIAGIAALVMGATTDKPARFVARAATLNPAPIVTTPSEPVVQQTVEGGAESPTPAKQGAAGVSGGSRGYVARGGNCVTFVCSMAPGLCQRGNAGSWRANSSTPSIGAVMIFRPGQQGASGAGHVGIVTGINSNGTINLAHANWYGQTTFYSTGLFYR